MAQGRESLPVPWETGMEFLTSTWPVQQMGDLCMPLAHTHTAVMWVSVTREMTVQWQSRLLHLWPSCTLTC